MTVFSITQVFSYQRASVAACPDLKLAEPDIGRRIRPSHDEPTERHPERNKKNQNVAFNDSMKFLPEATMPEL